MYVWMGIFFSCLPKPYFQFQKLICFWQVKLVKLFSRRGCTGGDKLHYLFLSWREFNLFSSIFQPPLIQSTSLQMPHFPSAMFHYDKKKSGLPTKPEVYRVTNPVFKEYKYVKKSMWIAIAVIFF